MHGEYDLQHLLSLLDCYKVDERWQTALADMYSGAIAKVEEEKLLRSSVIAHPGGSPMYLRCAGAVQLKVDAVTCDSNSSSGVTQGIDLSTLSHAEKDELILSLVGQLEAAVTRIDELEKRLAALERRKRLVSHV